MSSIASVLLARGYHVTGSDLKLTDVTDTLVEQGATIFRGHAAANVKGAEVVVYSSAVRVHENEETVEAQRQRIPLIGRPEMLAELMRVKYGVGIAGTHGKTTTTSMVGRVVAEGGFDPTIIVGGKVAELNTNAVSGDGDIIIIEADEYDRTFLRLTPAISVITTIEAEHMDVYRDLADVHSAFLTFANAVPFFGAAIVCLDDPGVQAIIGGIERRLITYGTSRQAMIRADSVTRQGGTTHFDVVDRGRRLGRMGIRALGIHNVRNALAAVAVGRELDIHFEQIKQGLESYSGVQRRFQCLGEEHGILVIDDYAHHPTEVQATLKAASDGFADRRIVAVFQPHLYSRTAEFKHEFAGAFFNADVLLVTGVYPAREDPLPGVSGGLIADLARQRGHRAVHYIESKADLVPFLAEHSEAGDLVLFMGAGDIWRVARTLLDHLAQPEAA